MSSRTRRLVGHKTNKGGNYRSTIIMNSPSLHIIYCRICRDRILSCLHICKGIILRISREETRQCLVSTKKLIILSPFFDPLAEHPDITRRQSGSVFWHGRKFAGNAAHKLSVIGSGKYTVIIVEVHTT